MSEVTSSSTETALAVDQLPGYFDSAVAYFTGPFLGQAATFIIILIVAWIIGSVLSKVVDASLKRTTRANSELFRKFAVGWTKRGVLILGLIMALETIGIATAPLIAGLGIAGFIIGFALQGTLDNFASGLMLIIYRPFDVGHLINVNGILAKVEALTMVNTTLITPDNRHVIMPNSQVWGNVITNFSAKEIRRVDLSLGVSYSADLDHTIKVVKAHCEANELVLEDPGVQVEISEHGDSHIGLVVRPWCKTDDYWDVYFTLHRTMKQLLDAEGIEIPFPQRVVHQAPAE